MPDAVAEYIHKQHLVPHQQQSRSEVSRADRMKKNELRAQVATAVHACQDKKATDISILQLDAQASGFTDYFVICSGSNPRQAQAIADEVDRSLSAQGLEPTHREGYNQAEWVLLDYVDFVVHMFSEAARKFYDLERLWKTATRVELCRPGKARAQSGGEAAAPRKRAAKVPFARQLRKRSQRRRLANGRELGFKSAFELLPDASVAGWEATADPPAAQVRDALWLWFARRQ